MSRQSSTMFVFNIWLYLYFKIADCMQIFSTCKDIHTRSLLIEKFFFAQKKGKKRYFHNHALEASLENLQNSLIQLHHVHAWTSMHPVESIIKASVMSSFTLETFWWGALRPANGHFSPSPAFFFGSLCVSWYSWDKSNWARIYTIIDLNLFQFFSCNLQPETVTPLNSLQENRWTFI